jgi:hypothetical protein
VYHSELLDRSCLIVCCPTVYALGFLQLKTETDQFRNEFSSYLQFLTLDKAQNPSDSEFLINLDIYSRFDSSQQSVCSTYLSIHVCLCVCYICFHTRAVLF